MEIIIAKREVFAIVKYGCVVLNYNTVEQTIKNTDILISRNRELYVTIVDNCSPSDDYAVLSEYYRGNARVDVIVAPDNGGYSKGNNFGIHHMLRRYPGIRYIAIMNPDVRCDEEDMICTLAERLDEDPEMAMIAPLMIEHDRVNMRKIGWNLPTFRELLLSKMYFAGRLLRYSDNPYVPCSTTGILKYDAVQGSFFLIKREIFEALGFFDEQVFMYWEENILGARLKQQNASYYAGVDPTHSYIHEHDFRPKDIRKRQRTLQLQFASEKYYVKQYSGYGAMRRQLLNLFGYFYIRVEVVVADMVKTILGKIKGEG